MDMNKIHKWQELASRLKQVKDEEANLRREICEEIFEGAVGAFSKTTKYGSITIKATSIMSYRLDEGVLDSIWPTLTESEKDCVKFKPSLSAAKYSALVREASEPVNLVEAITTSPGMPRLEVKNDN